MAKLLSNLITKQMQWHANRTEKNHLGKALIIKPEVFEGVMNKLFTSEIYSDNPLTTMLVGENRKKTINATEWEWGLRGATCRPLVVTENVIPTVTQPGVGRTTFQLKLDEDWYKAGDIIHPGNKEYAVRIQEVLGRKGNGTVYLVRLYNDGFDYFLPVQYLKPGTSWAKLFSQYEEAAEQSGSTQYALPITLKNRMSRYRKEYSVTGDAANEILAVKIPDSKGTMHDTWIKYAEVEYWMQWYRELERGAWYSRYTDTVLGANGRPIYSGPGVQEQLKDSHVHYYSYLSAKLIEEYLMDIFYGRVKPGSKRSIKAFTGEYGMIIFHNAIQDWMEKSAGFIKLVDSHVIDKTSSEYHKNPLVAGYQFMKYRMANGAELELVHNPLYDDREINFEIDPITGYPKESMRFTFLDFSEGGLKSNVQWIDKQGGFKHIYIHGMHSPYGPVQNKEAAHSGDYYEMHIQKQFGIHIEDVTKCGELILQRN